VHLLYNSQDYLNVWPEIKAYSFYITDKINHEIAGYVRFQVFGDTAFSLYRAPFGSFTISEKVDFRTLHAFIGHISEFFKNIKIKKIEVKHYPAFYQPGMNDEVVAALGLKGFKVSKIDINHHLEISGVDFSSLIHPMEARRLKKNEKAGFVFSQHQNIDAEMLFSTIVSFRQAKKIPVNIDYATLQRLVHAFPDEYRFYSVSRGNEIIATTICIQVNQTVLYNFLPAHDVTYNNYSPMVYLMEGIYNEAAIQETRILDLGISSLEGELQSGLITFKERLGGIPKSKLTFLKVI
jgi:hypothetical protein